MKEKACWLNSPIQSKWPSAMHLSNSYKLRYQQKFILTTNSNEKLIILGDVHYPGDYLLQKISSIDDGANILFHLYGDIFSRLKFVEKNREIFKNKKIKFVLGSKSAFEIAKNILSEKNLLYLPYHVIPNFCHTQKKEKSDIIKIIYFGRISYFKNVHHLLNLFDQFTDTHSNYELHIVGAPDNTRWRNNPTASYFNYAGEIFYEAYLKLKRKNKNVYYHGKIEQQKLFELVSKMDIFTSLSTAEEEDFGIALYESLERGLKIVTTEWGGFRQFNDVRNVQLVPVQLNKSGLQINPEDLFHKWLSPEKEGEDIIERNKSWKDTPLTFNDWSELGDFKEKFIMMNASTFTNKEFYEHGREILYPLWC